jgi:hypothetical protein
VQECGIGAGRIESDFGIAHARDLIAGSLDDVGAGFDVGAMDSDDLLGRILKHMRGPERAVDVGAKVFEFGGHAAVKDVKTVEESFTSM